jgi:hypothetical protein
MSRLAAMIMGTSGTSFGAPVPAPRSWDLAMRDPARAAAFGLFGKGPKTRNDGTFGGERGTSFGDDSPMGFGFGEDAFTYTKDVGGRKFSDTVRGGHGAGGLARDAIDAYRGAGNMAHHAQVQRWRAMEQELAERKHAEKQRRTLLYPNEGSDLKVERYGFPIPQSIPALGTPYLFTNYFGQPDTQIRPERVLMNAPGMAFVTIADLKVSNVSGLVGGATDAAFFAPGAFNVHLSLPTLSPANKLNIQAAYTGYVPPGYPVMVYPFVVQVNGPATVAGSD